MVQRQIVKHMNEYVRFRFPFQPPLLFLQRQAVFHQRDTTSRLGKITYHFVDPSRHCSNVGQIQGWFISHFLNTLLLLIKKYQNVLSYVIKAAITYIVFVRIHITSQLHCKLKAKWIKFPALMSVDIQWQPSCKEGFTE